MEQPKRRARAGSASAQAVEANATAAKVASWVSLLQTLVRSGAWVAVAYFAFKIVEVLAGKDTNAKIDLNFLSSLTLSSSVAWAGTVGGLGWGLAERRLRKKNIERMSKHIQQLEAGIDPGRTSSNLTARGDTNPGDR